MQRRRSISNQILKISSRSPRSIDDGERGFFHVVVLQITAKKCTNIYTARAHLLFCSLNLLFDYVLVAVVVVVCLSSLSALLRRRLQSPSKTHNPPRKEAMSNINKHDPHEFVFRFLHFKSAFGRDSRSDSKGIILNPPASTGRKKLVRFQTELKFRCKFRLIKNYFLLKVLSTVICRYLYFIQVS